MDFARRIPSGSSDDRRRHLPLAVHLAGRVDPGGGEKHTIGGVQEVGLLVARSPRPLEDPRIGNNAREEANAPFHKPFVATVSIRVLKFGRFESFMNAG